MEHHLASKWVLLLEYSKGSKKDNRLDVMLVNSLAQWMDLPKEHLSDLPMVHEMELLMDGPMVMRSGHLMEI